MLTWKHLGLLASSLVLSGCFSFRPSVSALAKECPAAAKASAVEATYSDVPWAIRSTNSGENSLYLMLTQDDSLTDTYRAGWTTSIEHLAGPGKRYRVCLRDGYQRVVKSREIDLVFEGGYFWGRRHHELLVIYIMAAIREHIITIGIGAEGQLCAVRSVGGTVLFGLFPLTSWMEDRSTVYPRVSSMVTPQMTHEIRVDPRQVILRRTSGINRNAEVRAQQRDANRW